MIFGALLDESCRPKEMTSAMKNTPTATTSETKPNQAAISTTQMESGSNHETIATKPVLYRENTRTVLNLENSAFQEKMLCDGITLNLGDACVFSCEYCYVPDQMRKIDKPLIDDYNAKHPKNRDLGFHEVVIRRRNALTVLYDQLINRRGLSRFADPCDDRVVYSSTLVDVAATMNLLYETAAACSLILEHTHWQIRLLSKGNLLHQLFKMNLIPTRYRDRMILGFSTGTADDGVASAIESGTALVSKRLTALHWLQDQGYRTFGMICPSLPQAEYESFSSEICEAIRVDRCEHIWAEVINVRGDSFIRTLAALDTAGLSDEAIRLSSVSGPGNRTNWENYARDTFVAHTQNIPPHKLRFLQYVTPESRLWWANQQNKGALLLGSAATPA